MSNMLNCVEQEQLQNYKTYACGHSKTAGVLTTMLKHPTKQFKNNNNNKTP